MKIKAWEVERFLADRPAALRAVLLYGPDDGLVRERAARLASEIVEDPADSFARTTLTADALAKDPARLADEAAAIAMTGGRRLVVIDPAGDKAAPACGAWLEAPAGDGFVIAVAGELAPRSKLRQAFERADIAAALPCYPDDERSLEALIRRTMEENGLTLEDDALAYLIGNLGSDRMLTRRELEKLVLYMNGSKAGGSAGKESKGARITLEDAQACIGDSSALTLDTLVRAVCEGDMAGLDRALQRLGAQGENPVSILRALARHFQRLHRVAGAMDGGAGFDQAIKRLRPPVFGRGQKQMRGDLNRWPPARLAGALDILLEAEMAVKSTGQPAEAICARTCLRLARAAAR